MCNHNCNQGRDCDCGLNDAMRISEALSAAHQCLERIRISHHGRSRIEADLNLAALRTVSGQILGPDSMRTMDHMQTARIIADAACCIDGLKDILRPFSREEADYHAERLHDIAEKFAGDRVREIYGPANEGVTA